MRIYAVMDLMAGQVVHAVAGQRERYRPIRSVLVDSADPHSVAHAFVSRCGIRDAYVADLDALTGGPPQTVAWQAIADAGMRILLDAGLGSVEQVERLLHSVPETVPPVSLVVALESTAGERHWRGLLEQIGPERAVFSLDLRGGVPLASALELATKDPTAIAELAWQAGFRRLIVLDLQSVGVDQGLSTLTLCQVLSQNHSWTELISGGGVRGADDLAALKQAGCHAALVASALHTGQLHMLRKME